MQWIDTHVHLFSNDGDNAGMPPLKATGGLNTPDVYFEQLGENAPEGVVVVDFSKAQASDHVIVSLDELKEKGIKAAGVVKGNLADERTLQWLERDDVKGIRLYAKTGVPDISSPTFTDVFRDIQARKQHVLVFGAVENLVALIAQIPVGIPVLVDHLGLPCIQGEKDEEFAALLEVAKLRGNIYFKGPGYRTSLKLEIVTPFIKDIVAAVGVERLMLGASDGPFAGPVMETTPEFAGQKYCDLIDYAGALKYVTALADITGAPEKVLYENAKELYGF